MVFSFFYANNLKLGSLYCVSTLYYVLFIDLYKLIIDSLSETNSPLCFILYLPHDYSIGELSLWDFYLAY